MIDPIEISRHGITLINDHNSVTGRGLSGLEDFEITRSPQEPPLLIQSLSNTSGPFLYWTSYSNPEIDQQQKFMCISLDGLETLSSCNWLPIFHREYVLRIWGPLAPLPLSLPLNHWIEYHWIDRNRYSSIC